jgi:hypothetical protein
LRRERLYRAGFALALVGLAAGLALGAARGDSITVDEPIHLLAGYGALAHGDLRLSPEHPPLARMWAALPLLAAGPRWPPPAANGWRAPDYLDLARDWLTRWNDGMRLIAPARTMMVALLAALCLATAEAARRLLGPAGAALALVVAALDPTLLAHGHYVTTDLPAALASLLVLLTASRLFAAPTPSRFALAALALGAASLVKFSWLLLLPALGAAAGLAVLSPRLAPGLPPGRAARAGVVAALAVGLGAAVALAIWTAYGLPRPLPGGGGDPASDPGRLPAVLLHLPAAEPASARQGGAGPGSGRAPATAAETQQRGAGPGAVHGSTTATEKRQLGAGPGVVRLPATAAELWQAVLQDPATGRPLAGLPRLVAFARDRRLLPEPYLYGLAYTYRKSLYRSAFLIGRYSTTGWRWYFPLAFLLKTPLPTLLLLTAGLAALVRGRRWGAERPRSGGAVGRQAAERQEETAARPARRQEVVVAETIKAGGGGEGMKAGGGGAGRSPGDGLLAAGLISFAAVYAAAAVASRLDIGQRHLLPLYPAVFVGAGAAAAWLREGGRLPRLAIAALGLWLLGGTLLAFPGYLGYFNELAGGARRGHLYLSDSNVDWGQDLLRLAAWARRHPREPIRLAQFGPVPMPRGFSPGILLDGPPGEPLAPLDAGTYAASATELAGVYHPLVRDGSWRHAELRALYLRLTQAEAAGRLAPASAAANGFDLLRRLRLLNALRHRPADERIGTSLFLFRLGEAELRALTRLPDRLDVGIAAQAGVAGDQRGAEAESGGDDEPVGRVVVDPFGQGVAAHCNAGVDRNEVDEREGLGAGDPVRDLESQGEAPLADQERDFPAADRRDVDGTGLDFHVDPGAGRRRELLGTRDPPDPGVGVEHDQRSASHWSSPTGSVGSS